MDKHYDAKAAEAKWYPFWEKNGCFHDEPGAGTPYSVVIPPPNVTGILHMGITDDFARRFAAHNAGKGAKYTRGRGPLALRYLEKCEDKSAALKREATIKKLPKSKKLELCNSALVLSNS